MKQEDDVAIIKNKENDVVTIKVKLWNIPFITYIYQKPYYLMDFIKKKFAIADAPAEVDGVLLSKLGKKNWIKLYNQLTGKLSIVTSKNCKNCGESLDWRVTGQIYKDKRNGNYYYQNNCNGGCHKEVVNDVVKKILLLNLI